MFIVSSIVNFALLYAGITYFRKTERTFADVI
jgi:ABC-type polysaccharide/polyol phosphate export permease